MVLESIVSKVEGDKHIKCLYSRGYFSKDNSASQGVSSLPLKSVPVFFTGCQDRDASEDDDRTVIPHRAVAVRLLLLTKAVPFQRTVIS